MTETIAANVTEFVRDGDAVQVGIGKLGDAGMSLTRHHR